MLPHQLAACIRRLGDANDPPLIVALLTELEQRWPADPDALTLRRIAAMKHDRLFPSPLIPSAAHAGDAAGNAIALDANAETGADARY